MRWSGCTSRSKGVSLRGGNEAWVDIGSCTKYLNCCERRRRAPAQGDGPGRAGSPGTGRDGAAGPKGSAPGSAAPGTGPTPRRLPRAVPPAAGRAWLLIIVKPSLRPFIYFEQKHLKDSLRPGTRPAASPAALRAPSASGETKGRGCERAAGPPSGDVQQARGRLISAHGAN